MAGSNVQECGPASQGIVAAADERAAALKEVSAWSEGTGFAGSVAATEPSAQGV